MQAAEMAQGRWPGILANFGLDERALSGRHGPCPVCDGRDRFRFDNKDGRGTFYCAQCGAGDGFDLLCRLKGWSFKEAVSQVKDVVGSIGATASKPTVDSAEKLAQCKRVWSESRAVIAGDPVSLYLARRIGLEIIPARLHYHPALSYRHDDGSTSKHPAMLAHVTALDGTGVALHRTYLTSDGQKADVPAAKKVLGRLPAGAAVRLSGTRSTTGIAEGVETALSASMAFGLPVWSAICSGGLEKWTPPTGVNRVVIFGDNDLSGTGQAAAWNLAKRLIATGLAVDVKIPPNSGTDWADKQTCAGHVPIGPCAKV